MKRQKLPSSLVPTKKQIKARGKTNSHITGHKQKQQKKPGSQMKPNISNEDNGAAQQRMSSRGMAKQSMKKYISAILCMEEAKYYQGDPEISTYSVSHQGEKLAPKNQILCEADKNYFAGMKQYISSLINSAVADNNGEIQGGDKTVNKSVEMGRTTDTKEKQQNSRKRISEIRFAKNISSLNPSISKINRARMSTVDKNGRNARPKNSIPAQFNINEMIKNIHIQNVCNYSINNKCSQNQGQKSTTQNQKRWISFRRQMIHE